MMSRRGLDDNLSKAIIGARTPNGAPRSAGTINGFCEGSMTEAGEHHWGSLGEPEQPAAKLLHVVDTPVATMRHAFYQPGATVPNYCLACDTLVYGVGGPCIQHHDGARLVRRRLMFYPKGYAHRLEFLGPAHILAIELYPRNSSESGFSGLEEATPLPATLYTPVWRAMLKA